MQLVALILFTLSVAASLAIPFQPNGGVVLPSKPIPQPQQSQPSETIWDINKLPIGTDVSLGQKGNLFEKGDHRLDGTALLTKQFDPNGPLRLGGGLEYTQLPTDSKAFIKGTQTNYGGNLLDAGGSLNLWKPDKLTTLDLVGSYQRNFGGLGGTTNPQFYGGLQFQHRFQ